MTESGLTFRIATSVSAEVVDILIPAMGEGSSSELSARTRRTAEASTTVTAQHLDRLVAAVCVHLDGTEGRITAVAVSAGDRGRGWGRSLMTALPSLLGASILTAETDHQAVGFYRALGFSVRSLGEKYPGVERFACRFDPNHLEDEGLP